MLLRDLADNGILADLHKETCSKEIYRRVEMLEEPLRNDLKKALNTLKDRNRVSRRRKRSALPLTGQQWVETAKLEPALHAIVVDELNGSSDGDIVGLDDVLYSERWTQRSHTWTISMNVMGYRRVLTPLLRHARKLVLVDPYLCVNDAYKPVIELCAELLDAGRDKPDGFIKFHAKTQGSQNDVKWGMLLGGLKARFNHKYKVCLYKNLSQQFHDRFVLTNQCGVSAPNSLRVVHGGSTDWHLMDYGVANTRRAEFEAPVHPYLKHVDHEPLTV